MRNLLENIFLAGKKLQVREHACDTKQNGFLGKKSHVIAEIHQVMQIFGPYLSQLKAENIMHEVEVKLSAMPLGGRKRVLY